MEPRWLLSSWVVTSLADDGTAGTLRYEIQQAAAAGGDQTVTFNAALTADGHVTVGTTAGALALDDETGAVTVQGRDRTS